MRTRESQSASWIELLVCEPALHIGHVHVVNACMCVYSIKWPKCVSRAYGYVPAVRRFWATGYSKSRTPADRLFNSYTRSVHLSDSHQSSRHAAPSHLLEAPNSACHARVPYKLHTSIRTLTRNIALACSCALSLPPHSLLLTHALSLTHSLSLSACHMSRLVPFLENRLSPSS